MKLQEEQGWGLLVPFDTDDPEFVRGFECGQVWAELWGLPGPVCEYRRSIHTSNESMVERIARACRFRSEFTDSEPGWSDVLLTRDLDMPLTPPLRLVRRGEQ